MSGCSQEDPQDQRSRDERLADVAETFAVLVDLGCAFERVQVADHVEEDEQEPDDAGDGHGVLLPDVCPVDLDDPRQAA